MPPPAVLAVDQGNSAIKAGIVVAGRVVQSIRAGDAAALGAALAGLELPPEAVICTVVPDRLAPVEVLLRRRGCRRVRVLGRDLPVPLRHRYETPATLGQDRLAAAFAAFALVRGAVVVLDAGSALTVDWVDGDGTFRGGAILPGLRALGAALNAAAPRLDWGTPDPGARYPGTTSRDACIVGVTAAARGAVKEIVAEARQAAGAGVPLLATGGDAALVLALWPDGGVQVSPDLVLLGAAAAAAPDEHG